MIQLTKTRSLSAVGHEVAYGALAAFAGASIALAADHSRMSAVLISAVFIGLLLIVLLVARGGIARLILPVTVIGAFFLPLNALRPIPWFSLGDVFIALLMLLVLLLRATKPDAVMSQRCGGFLLGVFVMIFGGLVGSFQSHAPTESLLNLLRLAAAAVGVPVCLILWNPAEKQVRNMLWAWQLGNSTSIIFGLIYAKTYFGRAYGLTTHVNHFGLLCLLSVGVGCALLVQSRPFKRWVALTSIVLAGIGVLESGSRAALLGLAGWVLIITWAWRGPRALLMVAFLGASGYLTVASHLLALPTHNAYSRLTSADSGASESNSGRLELIQVTLTDIERHPFLGNGLAHPGRAHDIYLQMWATTGLLGLAGFGLVAWSCAKPLISTLARRGSLPMHPRQVLSATYVAYLIAAVFANNVWDRYLWFIVGLVLVLPSPARATGNSLSPTGVDSTT